MYWSSGTSMVSSSPSGILKVMLNVARASMRERCAREPAGRTAERRAGAATSPARGLATEAVEAEAQRANEAMVGRVATGGESGGAGGGEKAHDVWLRPAAPLRTRPRGPSPAPPPPTPARSRPSAVLSSRRRAAASCPRSRAPRPAGPARGDARAGGPGPRHVTLDSSPPRRSRALRDPDLPSPSLPPHLRARRASCRGAGAQPDLALRSDRRPQLRPGRGRGSRGRD